MKKNRLLIVLIVFLSALSSLGAATIDEIVESAKNNSPSYQNYILTYQNALVTVRELEEEDGVGIVVSATVEPLSQVGSDSEDPLSSGSDTAGRGIVVNPSVSVTLPNDGSTTITGSTRLTTSYKDGSTSISGSLGVSHTFDFSPYDSDNADNLSYTSTKYSTELTYKESELTFKKTVLNSISSILNLENSILKAEWNVEKQQNALDKLNALGTYETTSATYINTENMLVSYQQSLSALEEQYENLLSSYKTLTGLEWDGVEVGDAPELVLTTYENGNTSVIIESLDAESREETYKKTLASANPSSLSTALELSAASSSVYNISGTLTYSGDNWNVSVKSGVDITSTKTTPTVTISGTWRNKSGSSNKEGNTLGSASSDDDVNTALNNAKIAANNYLEALSSYNESVSDYSLKIVEYNNTKSQAEAELEYKEKLLENEKTLYDLGLGTSDSLKSAELDYQTAETEWKKVVIEGLSLQCDLDIFAL